MNNKDEPPSQNASSPTLPTQDTSSQQTTISNLPEQSEGPASSNQETTSATDVPNPVVSETQVNQGITERTIGTQMISNQATQATNANQPTDKKLSISTQTSPTIHFNETTTSNGSPTPSNDDTELDADILEDVLFYIGDMGLYQKLMFMAMLPFATFFVWVYTVQIFITVTPTKFWCKIPELSHLSMGLRRNLSAPGAATGEWDSCHTFDVDWKKVLQTLNPPSPDTPKIPCPNGWEFEYDEIPYSTVTSERGWVCGSATNAPTAQSIFFGGAFVGALLFGWIADNFGRIPALVGSNLIGGIGGISTTFTTGVWDFFFCRFLVGMSFDNCFMIAYILLLEYVGPGHRTCVANMPIAIFSGLAGVILPWIAYFVADWRKFLYITASPMFAMVLSYWLMPESVRWLVSRGRIDDAVKVLRKFEKVNKTHVPDEVMNTFVEVSKKIGSKKMASFFTIFRSSLLRITMVYMVLVYSSNAAIYDTLIRITQMFGLDFFITFTINWGIEIPSVLAIVILLDRLGRRLLSGASLFLGGIILFVAMFMPKGVARVIPGVMARFLINLAFTALCQWGTEILPTPFRASGSAALHMTGFVVSLLSPFIVHSEAHWAPLPLLIVSIWSVITGVLCILLPETKGQEMPQTVMDAEKIIQNQSICRKPEMAEFKKSLSKVLSQTISDPIHRNPEGRVSHLRMN